MVTVVVGFELCRWDVAAGGVQAALVPPGDPGSGGQLDVFDGLPGSLPVDQFGFVEAVDGLG